MPVNDAGCVSKLVGYQWPGNVRELRNHHGSLARSAEALGVAKTTLHDKIRKYGLSDTGAV